MKISKYLLVTYVLFYAAVILADSNLIGKKAPDFNLIELNTGNTVTLKQFNGKVVILDFWASWCAPCKKTLPILQSIKNQFKDKIEILTINIDEKKENAESFVKRYKFKLKVLFDKDQKVVEKFQIPEMPTLFIIDKKGNINMLHSGYTEDYQNTLTNIITKLL